MLKAEDIWYSFMRTKLFDRDFRRANGGSKALDEHFIKKARTATLFQENGRFSNEYLFGFFDLDVTNCMKVIVLFNEQQLMVRPVKCLLLVR